MKYIVYLTTNTKSKINGINRIYVGVHKTENPEIFDGYIGCGVYINKPSSYMYPKTPFQYAVKKYGTKSFIRSVLYIYDNKNEAFDKERKIVDFNFIKQDYTYNIAIGGIGGSLECVSPKVHSKILYQFDLNGELLKKWDSTLDACDFYGFEYSRFNWAITDKTIFLNSLWSREETIDIKKFTQKLYKITYLYNSSGKLVSYFCSRKECANYLECTSQSISNAIRNQTKIKNMFVSDSLYDEFIPKNRAQIKNAHIFLYKLGFGFIGEFVGKEIMNAIKLHSFKKINAAINDNCGWYKDYYLSLEKISEMPNKHSHMRKIEVYDKCGNLIEILDSVKAMKEKYNLNSASASRILKGIKEHGDFIFKYSK